MKYRVELTEEQMKIVQIALEEYFRLRMGQERDFCDDMAIMGRTFPKEGPEHNRAFDAFILRRDHLQEIMRGFFNIAFEPQGYLREKTDEMMIAECIWDAIRFARGQSRWGDVMQVGPEPAPKIEKLEDEP